MSLFKIGQSQAEVIQSLVKGVVIANPKTNIFESRG